MKRLRAFWFFFLPHAGCTHTCTDACVHPGFRLQATYKAAEAEQKRLIKEFGTVIDFDLLQNMDVLHRNITEAIRIHPPLVMLMRYARSAFTVTTSSGKEYVVPKVS